MTLKAQVGDAQHIISTLRKIGDSLGVVRASPTTARISPTVRRLLVTTDHPDKTTTCHEIDIGDSHAFDKWLTLEPHGAGAGGGLHVKVNEGGVIEGGLNDEFNGLTLEQMFKEQSGEKKSAGAKEEKGSKEESQGSGGKDPHKKKGEAFAEAQAKKDKFAGKN